jgi:hypothetical protein
VIELKDRVVFLNRIHLFNGLGDDQLAEIAIRLEERSFPLGGLIFERGDEPDGFYMVYRGRVQVTRPSTTGHEFLATLVAGDYFGEEALFANRKRSATVSAIEDTSVVFLSRANFDNLLKEYPRLKPNFVVAIKSRQLARRSRFKWLGSKEVIYFMARRHKIRLYQALALPILSLIFPFGLFSWGYLGSAITPIALGVVLLIVIFLWGLWNAIDWSNDYYIVTNQRVIWLEKVIGIYDSRQEAPLGTILSVGLETDMLGRAFDYGNVIVRTFVGKIEFDFVDHPAQASDMIREHWERTKARGVQAQKAAMKNSIRAKLGMTVQVQQEDELPPIAVENPKAQKRSMAWVVFSNLFKLRVENAGTVIYRKHWIVLTKQILAPLVFIFVLISWMIGRIIVLAQSPELTLFKYAADTGRLTLDTIMLGLPLIMLPFFGWLVWQYVDWKNDIFMVTPDEIVDIDKTPFGTEERRAAQLDNILSTEYKRIGLVGNVFNFGTVYIVVGGSKLEFQDVVDPAGVQADINRRRMARLAKRNEETANIERERMAAWIAAYHQNQDEFNGSTSESPEDVSAPTQAEEIQNPGDDFSE